jgi:dihydroorotase
MKMRIKNGRVIDPASGFNVVSEVSDVAIAAGRMVSLKSTAPDYSPNKTIDASGKPPDSTLRSRFAQAHT